MGIIMSMLLFVNYNITQTLLIPVTEESIRVYCPAGHAVVIELFINEDLAPQAKCCSELEQ